jgi:hypothetical protein
MSDIHNLFEIDDRPTFLLEKPKIDKITTTVIRGIIDIIVFIGLQVLIFFIAYDLFDNSNRDRDGLIILLYFSIFTFYVQLSNSNLRLLAFAYSSIIIVFYIFGTVYSRTPSFLVNIFILIIPFIFHFTKRLLNIKKAKNYIPTQLVNAEFNLVGIINNPITFNDVRLGKELDLKRTISDSFKPSLVYAKENENKDLILKYTNNDDMHFTVLVENKTKIYINHWDGNEHVQGINQRIFVEINKLITNE